MAYIHGDVLTWEEALQVIPQFLWRDPVSFDIIFHHVDGVAHEVVKLLVF